MSTYWILSCMDCNSGVSLGKLATTRYEEVGATTLGVLGYDISGSWRPDRETCQILDHFLVLHRGHELRFLPATVGGGDFPIERIFPYYDKRDQDTLAFLGRDVEWKMGDEEPSSFASDLVERAEAMKER